MRSWQKGSSCRVVRLVSSWPAYADELAYEVEFESPCHVVLTLEAEDVCPPNGQRVDRRVAKDLVGHKDRTARDRGQLLALAVEQFDILLTVDRIFTFLQNLVSFSIAVVLRANTNRLADLRPLVRRLAASAPPGVATFVE